MTNSENEPFADGEMEFLGAEVAICATRLVVAGTGPLPMSRRHNELWLFAGEDIGTEQMRCGAVLFGSDLQ